MGLCQSKTSVATPPPNHEAAKMLPKEMAHSSHLQGQNAGASASSKNTSVNIPKPQTAISERGTSLTSGTTTTSERSFKPGSSRGGSIPMDSSQHSTRGDGDKGALGRSTHSDRGALGLSNHNPKNMMHSSSVVGLDKLINERKNGGDLKNNIVHMEVPFGKPIEEVYDGVHDGPVLGSGISGLVRLCTHMATGAKYAVKCLDLGLVETEEGLQQLREEIAIMCQLDHPNIIRLEEVYESHSEIYLVQELCVGGELFDRLDEQPDYHYTEAQCARLVKQMLCSVRYCHSKGIIHRDLKLENFLFSTSDPDSELKMIDFGLSKHFKYGEVQHEAVGTPYTVAPEVIRGSYDERCDVWAIGVITYLLLSGDPPFGGCGGPESLMQVRSNILDGRFQFEPVEIWQHVSQEAKDFICQLLVTDPTNRPTAKVCQQSSWITTWADMDKSEEHNRLNTNVVKALVNFKEYSDMRKLLCEVLSFTLLPDQITDLRKEFEKLDIDGSGEISLRGLKQVLMKGAGEGSLGALTEEEVEDIFNAMRVRKTETRIHWHEFIAAGLSQCKVDDRNLRLAFERLDADHKGFVTFDNIMDLMGKDGSESEDDLRKMWASSMKSCQCSEGQVTFDDFLVLMKGQTVQPPKEVAKYAPSVTGLTSSLIAPPNSSLGVLHELPDSHSVDDTTVGSDSPGSPRKNSFGGDLIHRRISNGMVPSNDDFDEDEPMTMDADDDKVDEMISDSADIYMGSLPSFSPMKSNLTPPQSPVRSPMDHVTPSAMQRLHLSPPIGLDLAHSLPPLPDTLDFSRRRSKSVDDSDRYYANAGDDSEEKKINPDIRRAMLIPEHTHDTKDIESAIKDDTLTPLVVNRKLYRAHRQMRLAVLEASKRFEDQQFKRTRSELQAKQDAEAPKRPFGAGLVMRRGHKKELSSDAIRKIMLERQSAHQTLVDTAARRGGRGRRARKKTISDMSGMLLSISSDEMNSNGAGNGNGNGIGNGTGSAKEFASMSAAVPAMPSMAEKPLSKQELKLHDMHIPEPTVPGKFRVTKDPFQFMGDVLEEGKNFVTSLTSPPMKRINSNSKSSSDGELNLMAPLSSTP